MFLIHFGESEAKKGFCRINWIKSGSGHVMSNFETFVQKWIISNLYSQVDQKLITCNQTLGKSEAKRVELILDQKWDWTPDL